MTPTTQPAPGPLTRRIASAQPKPEPWRPPWLKNLKAKDLSGRLA